MKVLRADAIWKMCFSDFLKKEVSFIFLQNNTSHSISKFIHTEFSFYFFGGIHIHLSFFVFAFSPVELSNSLPCFVPLFSTSSRIASSFITLKSVNRLMHYYHKWK